MPQISQDLGKTIIKMENARKGSIFIDLGVQQIQNHKKKCLQVKVDIPAAINKK